MAKQVSIVNYGVVAETVQGDLNFGGPIHRKQPYASRNDGAVAEMVCSLFTFDELVRVVAGRFGTLRHACVERMSFQEFTLDLIRQLRDANLMERFLQDVEQLKPFQAARVESIRLLLRD